MVPVCIDSPQLLSRGLTSVRDKLLNNHTRVVAAKSECVAKCGVDCFFLRLAECKVETAVEIGIVGKMVDGRWNNIVFNGHDTGYCFHHSGGTKAVPCHRFG